MDTDNRYIVSSDDWWFGTEKMLFRSTAEDRHTTHRLLFYLPNHAVSAPTWSHPTSDNGFSNHGQIPGSVTFVIVVAWLKRAARYCLHLQWADC